MIYRLSQKFLFQLDAEQAHHATMRGLHASMPLLRNFIQKNSSVEHPNLRVSAFGLNFPNPVGLAAGFDKNAEHAEVLFPFGFGHIEVGTITGQAQPGNPHPRLFRLPADQALLNRMGFNNHGAEAVAKQLQKHRPDGILGINIGKTKVVDNSEAHLDYEKSLRLLHEFGDYFVVNVSSPNTPGLRALQDREPLEQLLSHLQAVNHHQAQQNQRPPRPLLLKIAPDLTDHAIAEAVEVATQHGLSGIVATNTTITREGLRTPNVESLGPGGISGRPVRALSLDVVKKVRQHTVLPIIGVGGIFGPQDAHAMLQAGATLVQVWTGFVYQGPLIVRDINRGLLAQGWKASATSEDPTAT